MAPIWTTAQRRRLLIARHRLRGDASGPVDVTRSMVALHATDPASVYLSVLARSANCTIADVAHAMYDARSLVRWMAMRRTLFVFERDDVASVQASISNDLAGTLRRALINRLVRNGTEPPLPGDAAEWLRAAGDDVLDALRRRGEATGAQLGADVPRLRTTVLPRAASDRPATVTSNLLTILGTEGRIVRSSATGVWTARQHRWAPIENWWPDGLPPIDPATARAYLARRWLERFGPATVDDLQWWTGWNKTVTRNVLTCLDVDEVELGGRPGLALAGTEPENDVEPVATLLPALDPTPMGWKNRDWFFDVDPRPLFDRAGNIGPTVWWNGAIVGSWAMLGPGEIRTSLLTDVGADATTAIRAAAEDLAGRLGGALVTPYARTPLERAISSARPQP